MKILKAIILS